MDADAQPARDPIGGLDAPVVVIDDLAHDGQPETMPGARRNLRSAVEGLEQPRQIRLRHARPAIIDAHAQVVANRRQRDAQQQVDVRRIV